MIYAKTLNPEWFDYRIYECDFEENNVLVDGGRDFGDIDPEHHIKHIKELIDDYKCYNYEYYYENSIKAYLTDMLPKKVNGKKLSPKEISTIKKALDSDYRYYSDYEQGIIELCLSIIYGKEYKATTIRDCMQSEYATLYAPVGIDTDYYEAIYFGTGTEIMIHDDNTEPKDADDVCGYTILTTKYDYKKVISEYTGTPEDEIVLWVWDGYTHVSKYERT